MSCVYLYSISKKQNRSTAVECMLARTFSCIKLDWRKARERELATFDETRQAEGKLNPMRDKKQRHVTGRSNDTYL